MFVIPCFRVDNWAVFEETNENTYTDMPLVPEMIKDISFSDELPRPMTFKLRTTGQ